MIRWRRRPLPGQLDMIWHRPTNAQQVDIVRAQRGDREAMAKLCSAHDRYAIKLTNRWSHNARDWNDALQQARLGVVEAIMSYDLGKGGRLMTHVHWQIMRRLKDETRQRERAKAEVYGMTMVE
jgi:DNA-directed RNA polymerase specialized sigma subunit